MAKLKLGDPVILTHDVDSLRMGTVGMLNAVVEIKGVEYAYFMPSYEQKSYVLRMAKLALLDEEEVQRYPELIALMKLVNSETDKGE